MYATDIREVDFFGSLIRKQTQKGPSWIGLKSGLSYYSDTYILAKGPITVVWILAPAEPENVDKEVAFKNYDPLLIALVKKQCIKR